MSNHTDVYIGRRFGAYQITREIAQGPFGSVYLARHVHLHHSVAIRLLHKAHADSTQKRERFLQELQLLAKLKHPHIVSIHEFGMDGEVPYMVTEYAPGGSLQDLLTRELPAPLPIKDAIVILSQVGNALYYAHQQSILHRDLKPANILFNEHGDALLADFGIAAIVRTTMTLEQGVKEANGSPAYMAPEQFKGVTDSNSDQYALGCIAYEMVTGRTPFVASSHDSWMIWAHKHEEEEPLPLTQLNPAIPEAVEQVVLRALAKPPHKRHVDLATFVAALQMAMVQNLEESTSFPGSWYTMQLEEYERLLRTESFAKQDEGVDKRTPLPEQMLASSQPQVPLLKNNDARIVGLLKHVLSPGSEQPTRTIPESRSGFSRFSYEPIRIFISHCRKDTVFARHLAQKLRAALGSAARVWFDEELSEEEAWWSIIADELTASDICIVVMSDFARRSRYVKDALKIAWNQRRFHKNFLLVPVICREMGRIPPEFDALPIVSFVRELYETAFDRLLKVMKFELLSSSPHETWPNDRAIADKPTGPLPDKQMAMALASEPGVAAHAPTSQREALLDIRSEIDALMEHSLARMSAHFYHLQGLSYLYEDDSQRAQWALERALELASEPAQRLTLLDEYTALFVTQQEWEAVLQRAEEALAIAPTDPVWQFVKEEALKRIAANWPEAILPLE